MSLVSVYEISSLWLASVTEQAGFSLTCSKIPKTGFLVTRLNWIAWWSPIHSEKTETQMVWPRLEILSGKHSSAGDSERSKKERKTEEEMGR